ncbi:unnamed protein product [Amoebophrya sp. A120]|nr:unnamed protein product [Amoebophrya sp. A120]|eukprot:GSA120T00005041001.1
MDLQLYYSCALESRASQFDFGSEEHTQLLKKLFDFLEKMKGVWWRGSDKAAIDSRYAELLANIFHSFREQLRLGRCGNSGEQGFDPSRDNHNYSDTHSGMTARSQRGTFVFFTFLLDYFSTRDEVSRGRAFRLLAAVFAVELVALAQQGGYTPARYYLRRVSVHGFCTYEDLLQEETSTPVPRVKELYRIVKNFHDVCNLVPDDRWDEIAEKLRTEIGGMRRCGCGAPSHGFVTQCGKAIVTPENTRTSFIFERTQLTWLCSFFARYLQHHPIVVGSGATAGPGTAKKKNRSTGRDDGDAGFLADSLCPHGRCSRLGAAVVKRVLNHAFGLETNKTFKAADVLGRTLSAHMDLLYPLPLLREMERPGDEHREFIDFYPHTNPLRQPLLGILDGAFSILYMYRYHAVGRKAMAGRHGLRLCPVMLPPALKEQPALTSKVSTRNTTGKQADVYRSWRCRVYECVYMQMLQYAYDLTSKRSHFIEPVRNDVTKRMEMPGVFGPDGKKHQHFRYGAVAMLYNFCVPACLIANASFDAEEPGESTSADTVWWGDDASASAMPTTSTLRHRLAMFLVSWKMQGLLHSTVNDKPWLDWLDGILYYEIGDGSAEVDDSDEEEEDDKYSLKECDLFGCGVEAYRTLRALTQGKDVLTLLADWDGHIWPGELRDAVAPVVLGHFCSDTHRLQQTGAESDDDENDLYVAENKCKPTTTSTTGKMDQEPERTQANPGARSIARKIPAMESRIKRDYSELKLSKQRRRDQALVTVVLRAIEHFSPDELKAMFMPRQRRGRDDVNSYAHKFRELLALLNRKECTQYERLRDFFSIWRDSEPAAIDMLTQMEGRCRPYDLVRRARVAVGAGHDERDVESRVTAAADDEMRLRPCPTQAEGKEETNQELHQLAVERCNLSDREGKRCDMLENKQWRGSLTEPPPQDQEILARQSECGKVITKPPPVYFYMTAVMGLENLYEALWGMWHLFFQKTEKETVEALKFIAAKLEVVIPKLD